MFCPKCGTKNPDDGKFCRSCGVDLGNVSAAMSGSISPLFKDLGLDVSCEPTRKKDPHDIYADAIKSIISGMGFLIVSMALFLTNVANGKAWFWALLFPAFTFAAKGVADLMKYRKLERAGITGTYSSGGISAGVPMSALPPTSNDFVPASVESRYKTGDLVPPSVTDNTTRHLEINREGETMALPKK